ATPDGLVRIQNLRRDALRQHVLGADEAIGCRVAVDVDEPGRNEETGSVELHGRTLARHAADARDRAGRHGDVGLIARIPGAVDDRAVADDDVVRRGRLGERDGDGTYHR